MNDTPNSMIDDDEEFPQIWELRTGNDILGILKENDWNDTPWWGYDFEPLPDYEKYRVLFEDERGLSKHRISSEIASTIRSLKLIMYPVDKAAQPSRVKAIVIDGKSIQLIPGFEYYNPPGYIEDSIDEES